MMDLQEKIDLYKLRCHAFHPFHINLFLVSEGYHIQGNQIKFQEVFPYCEFFYSTYETDGVEDRPLTFFNVKSIYSAN